MASPKPARADFFWPLAIVALVSMGLLVGLTLLLARQFDHSALADEQTVVENGLVGRVAEISQMVVPMAEWDDAVRHLDNRYDPAWTRQNIGAQLYQVDGFSNSVVLLADDRAVFAAHKGVQANVSGYHGLVVQAASLIAAVRQAERRRGPIAPVTNNAKMVASPIQSNTITVIDGEVAVLSATLVQPDFGTAALSGARAPIILTSMTIDKAFLEGFARRYLLRKIHLHLGDSRSERDEAHAPMIDNLHQVIATIDWAPKTPGTAMLRSLVTPVLIIVCVLGSFALLLYRRSRRLAETIIASEARAAHLAYYDSLTGLPNRVLFFDRLGLALRQLRRTEQKIAVHCIDLDRFKFVNDTFGHHVGDLLIQEAGRRMAAECRACDTFARLSGDEFAIIQTDATPHSAAALAGRLTKAMAEPVLIGSVRVFVGCSVGVTVIVDGKIDPAEALRQADLALFRAKETAKGKYCMFEVEMDAAIKMRRALESDLREALTRGELRMAYQPQVNDKGDMIAVEALVRWRHAERGEVSPAFFVPVAEECGLIVDLGLFTLKRAFEDSRRWGPLKVAINVSANQLRMADFVSNVADLVLNLDVDPRQFELEITEGVLLGDDPATQKTLKRLRGMGFGIALDDFGTGYSSLSYLKKYPIDKIKIDRSFVINLGMETDADAVVEAIVRLAQALHLSIIAEGVETPQQRDILKAAGCSNIQGYLYSKPVTALDIDRLSAERHAFRAVQHQGLSS